VNGCLVDQRLIHPCSPCYVRKCFHRDDVDVCQLFIITHLQKWMPGRPNFDPTCCPCCVGRVFSYGVDISKPNLDDVAMS
ncbi:hypothetical protein AVEN_111352-1, partial [Araneus ventricosus]